MPSCRSRRVRLGARFGCSTASNPTGHTLGSPPAAAGPGYTNGQPSASAAAASWSLGKSLADHKADRKAFVRDMLASVGIEKPEQDTSRLVWRKLAPGDRNVPPRAHLLMRAIAERITWRAEYDRALLAAQGPPGGPETSATPQAA